MDLDSIKNDLRSSSCRICLCNFESTNSLFDFVEYDEGQNAKIEIREMLRKLTNANISIHEAVKPVRICLECTEKLITSYEFICSAERNEKIVQEWFEAAVEEKADTEETEPAESVQYESADDQPVESIKFDDSNDVEFLEEEYVEHGNVEDEYSGSQNEIMIESCEETVEVWTPPSKNDEYDEEKSDEKGRGERKSIRKPRTTTNTQVKKERSGGGTVAIGSRLNTYETSKWHKCDDCDRLFAKLSTLERHIKLAHTPVSAEDFAAIAPKPTSEMPLQCEYCLRTFMRQDALSRHVAAMHTVGPDVQPAAQKPNQTKNRRMCPYCGEYFSQAGLIVHIRRHTGETPYQCEDCGKGFPRRQDLVLHMRQHSGERPHLCTVCGKSFKNPNKLTRHVRIHTGIRPYKCTKCDKGFAQSNDLKIHMRRHTGEKPYKCDVCGEAFICGAALTTHRKNKLHHESHKKEVDPYEKVRVRNRTQKEAGRMASVVEGEEGDEMSEEHIMDVELQTTPHEDDDLLDVL